MGLKYHLITCGKTEEEVDVSFGNEKLENVVYSLMANDT